MKSVVDATVCMKEENLKLFFLLSPRIRPPLKIWMHLGVRQGGKTFILDRFLLLLCGLVSGYYNSQYW